MLKHILVVSSLLITTGLSGCQKGTRTAAPGPVTPSSETQQLAAAEAAMLDRAYNGDTAAVRALLDQGVDVNMRGKENNTPIMEAAYAGQMETVKLLLDRGADLSVRKNDGATVIGLAGAHPEIVELFQDVASLVEAARKGDIKSVKGLIDKGVPVNGLDHGGMTALTEASWNGHIEIVKLLLDKGADPTINKSDGYSPLKLAQAQKQSEVAALLEAAIAKRSSSFSSSAGK
jgi:ankyrin repeat protein